MNSEGDTLLSDDAVEGLGKKLFMFCFGSIINIATPVRTPRIPSTNQANSPPTTTNTNTKSDARKMALPNPDPKATLPSPHVSPLDSSTIPSMPPAVVLIESISLPPSTSEPNGSAAAVIPEEDNLLTEYPSLGFFVAGAVAGAVSRTCTAPLDRLKTYLIASTAKPELALSAAAKGDVSGFIKHLGRPLVTAFQELWKSGGIRSLYSGMLIYSLWSSSNYRFH